MAGDSTDRDASLTVALVQRASSLDPAENRAALSKVVAKAVRREPKPSLVVLPEAFARDFGKPGSDVSPFAEPLDGPFVEAVAEQARTHGVTVVAGMFETSDDPERPYNTLVVVGPDGSLRATYRKIHLYDSFGYKESDRLVAGPVEPVLVDGKLYFASEDGDIFVVKAGTQFELLATNKMGEIVMATPAFAKNTLFYRTRGHLVAIGE